MGLAAGTVRAAGVVALIFGMLAMLLTPIAAVMILTLSVQRRWRLRVIGLLWVVVIGSMAIMLPAVDMAMTNWMAQGIPHDGHR